MTGIFASLVTNRGNTPFLSRVPSLETNASHGDGTAYEHRSPSIRAARRGTGDDHARGNSHPHPRNSTTPVSRTRGSKIAASRVLSPTPRAIFPKFALQIFYFLKIALGFVAAALIALADDELPADRKGGVQ